MGGKRITLAPPVMALRAINGLHCREFANTRKIFDPLMQAHCLIEGDGHAGFF